MVDARELVTKIRDSLESVEKRIRGHPYLASVEAGEVSREELRLFVGEQLHIIPGDLRSVAFLVSRCERRESQTFFGNVLAGEAAALEALETLADALGISQAERDGFEPSPGAQAYSYYLSWLCGYGSDAEVAAAFSVNFAAWGANCGRMADALKTKLGFEPSEVRFFTQFAEAPSEASREALRIIDAGLARGITTQQISRACRMLQGYELMFWDTVYERLKK
ncbi:MAG: hypothetical protein JSW58_13170 [Candidatus Latescibacterota bacterium]|nr:MAG: hypothetical protein JSW58_13170 [Candidatus Latescibacterota bacterium]